MKTKEDFYELVLRLRQIAADPQNRACSCPKTKCEWHGRCTDCVTIHRYGKDHVPNCFQQFINEKLSAAAAIGELAAVEKEKTPSEYWDYVRKMDGAAPGPEEMTIDFRPALESDAPLLLELYNFYIETTTATFDWGPVTAEEFRRRVPIRQERELAHLAFVDGAFAGFCFLTQYKKKPACAKTAEIGLYLKPEFTGRGLGRAIVAHLEAEAAEHGFEVIIASVSGENTPSLKLFRKLGYEQCAHYRKIGEKFGRKLDVADFQKELGIRP